MTAEQLVLLLGGLTTFIGGVVLAIRGLTGDRFQRKVTESANLLTGYTEQVKNLRSDMDAMREQHRQDMTNLRAAHAAELANQTGLHVAERERWNEERERLEERVETLEAQVTAFLLRPKSSRERKSDQ